jgi:hypothetical protein
MRRALRLASGLVLFTYVQRTLSTTRSTWSRFSASDEFAGEQLLTC